MTLNLDKIKDLLIVFNNFIEHLKRFGYSSKKNNFNMPNYAKEYCTIFYFKKYIYYFPGYYYNTILHFILNISSVIALSAFI